MAVIATPKGWAIEFEYEPLENKKGLTDLDFGNMADDCTEVASALLYLLQMVKTDDMTEDVKYHTLQVLLSMFPKEEQMKGIIKQCHKERIAEL